MQVNQIEKRKILRHLGVNLKYYRTKLNLSQEELAFTIGVERSYITAIEAGTKCPSLYCLFLLAKGLKISLNQLVDINID